MYLVSRRCVRSGKNFEDQASILKTNGIQPRKAAGFTLGKLRKFSVTMTRRLGLASAGQAGAGVDGVRESHGIADAAEPASGPPPETAGGLLRRPLRRQRVGCRRVDADAGRPGARGDFRLRHGVSPRADDRRQARGRGATRPNRPPPAGSSAPRRTSSPTPTKTWKNRSPTRRR